MATYSRTSPYYTTPVAGQYLDILDYRDIPAEVDDILWEVTPQYQNRPDLLAYDLYGDVNLWWVFSVRNKDTIKDPIYDMVAGTQIYLPKQTSITKNLGI